MAQPWAKWFYESPAWKHARKAYADTQHGLCERCKAKGLIVKGDIVHHKVYLTQDNITDTAITLSFDNFELLCFDCHNKEHNANARIRAGFGFDADGHVRPIG
ncbi:MAG: HNH endonuclease signature motif containing protein [Eggerthella sp.]|uniref:HNH endonuclease signature motif containing protein n=1 Tax=Eggerthella sp. TaxID=1929886 RepID=UPI00290208C3|nr:HNH endonuclease signature motif containing protein [Eggerthella sp.]MDU1389106.1 HNH endonuclease signature motif containing protein [Eggerthella sp.]